MTVTSSTRREATIAGISMTLLIGLAVIGDRVRNPSPLCPRPTYVQQLEAIALYRDFARLAQFPHPSDIEGTEALPVQWKPYSMCLLHHALESRERRGFGASVHLEERYSLPYQSASRAPFLTGCPLPPDCETSKSATEAMPSGLMQGESPQ